MTGYGQAEQRWNEYRLTAEIKSVNHRYAEVMIKLPREYMKFEEAVKRTVLTAAKRGRLDVFITIERTTVTSRQAILNWALLDGYRQVAQDIQQRYAVKGELGLQELLQLPDAVLWMDEDTESALPEDVLMQCVSLAMEQLQAMRLREGAHLSLDLIERLEQFSGMYAEVLKTAPRVADEYRVKLQSRIRDMLSMGESDELEQRVWTEAALFAERSNVDEELTRLASHMDQFKHLLSDSNPVGRKLDFLLQEMNREVNTIGSKANHSHLTKIVVDLKAELEKMREQVQNIE
ncbi:YicC/YloC family endoribonuclease [Paenibacillus swuensis]|nr:YicC/YloC family endoribonuclease [Paenibacillus swuensis]